MERQPFANVLVPNDPDRPMIGPILIGRGWQFDPIQKAADIMGLKDGEYTVRHLVNPGEPINAPEVDL